MSEKSQIETIVKKSFPGVRIVETLEGSSTRGGDLKRVHKAPTLDVMQRKVSRQGAAVGTAAAKPAVRQVAKKGPSGVVLVAPKDFDGPASRRKAKTVIVSCGKVIAVQG